MFQAIPKRSVFALQMHARAGVATSDETAINCTSCVAGAAGRNDCSVARL
jgi:hypothetical protein